MQFVTFGSDDVANVFASLTPAELDEVSFGVIQVDGTGRIILYNRVEGEIASYPPKAAIGRNFFTDVARCTHESGFHGRFVEGVRKGDLNVVFEWAIPATKERMIQVHLKSATEPDRYWIFVKRL